MGSLHPILSITPLLIVLIFFLGGCTDKDTELFGKCISCHTETHGGPDHRFACTSCHAGNSKEKDSDKAHFGLVADPAHPNHLTTVCGQCHEKEVTGISTSLHLTLGNKINLVRQTYGAEQQLSSLTEIPKHEDPESILELVDDLLRRRCLTCHLYYQGESYSATSHGTGCAACHMAFKKGKPVSHEMLASPTDNQCLSCHYGNYVGSDYYGRYEHDLNEEYRTPYYVNQDTRPYGVEYHQLIPDIHQQKGLHCIDCHSGNELMNTGNFVKPSCRSCHDRALLKESLPQGVSVTGDAFVFTIKDTGETLPLTTMTHPAHKLVDRVDCQACHAQWSFNDGSTHLLRSDLDDYEEWDRLTVQGSHELETLLENNLDFDKEELPPAMTDKISGDKLPGIWYKGYLERRWERMLLGLDENGRVTVVRPILDYTLSWIDEDETVRYDSVTTPAADNGLRPYTPHTTGKAGMFYELRIRPFLNPTE